MPYTSANCSDTKNCISLRKGLSAIATRRTGMVNAKSDTTVGKIENAAAPKEISAAKCASISILAL